MMIKKANAIIVAGGRGARMGTGLKKQYIRLDGIPIIVRTISAFMNCPEIDRICLVVPFEDLLFCRDEILAPWGLSEGVSLVAGGKERQESVFCGLNYFGSAEGIIVIHDGVRPFITEKEVSVIIEKASKHSACIFAIPLVETLKRTDADRTIVKTVERSLMWQAQTPQAFTFDLLKEAHMSAYEKGISSTDDAQLLEEAGHRVKVICGNRFNIKITTKEDLMLAEALISSGIIRNDTITRLKSPTK